MVQQYKGANGFAGWHGDRPRHTEASTFKGLLRLKDFHCIVLLLILRQGD